MEALMSEQDARHQAAREFGNTMLVAETSREVLGMGVDGAPQPSHAVRPRRVAARSHAGLDGGAYAGDQHRREYDGFQVL
jgi:hypothetical protein